MKIEKIIQEKKLQLVEYTGAHNLYEPAMKNGNIITTSGQFPIQDQRLVYPGRVGKDVSTENAQKAARVAVMNCLSAIKYVCHDLDKIKQVLNLNGYVCSALGYNDQQRVLNSASELLLEIFGDKVGQHTRRAIGVFELPFKSSVELEMVVKI